MIESKIMKVVSALCPNGEEVKAQTLLDGHDLFLLHIVIAHSHDVVWIIRCVFVISGVGRYRNESYGEFLKALNSAKVINTRIGPREVG